MSNLPLLLSQVDLPEVNVPWRTPSGALREYVLVLGAIVLVTLVLLLWAAFLRKRRHRHSHNHHHHSSGQPATPETNAGDSVVEPHRRRRRRRRREHRPRNPTLAETGGLPPVRTDKPSGPVP